jgi:hypothetical protein
LRQPDGHAREESHHRSAEEPSPHLPPNMHKRSLSRASRVVITTAVKNVSAEFE